MMLAKLNSILIYYTIFTVFIKILGAVLELLASCANPAHLP